VRTLIKRKRDLEPGEIEERRKTMTEKIITMYCPVCKEEKNFCRVVETHREETPFTIFTPIDTLHTWIQETQHPTAYCPICRIVLYVGLLAEKVKQEFK